MNQNENIFGWLAIQCTASNGLVGDFLYRKTGVPIRDSELLTPVFSSLPELFQYLKNAGWVSYFSHLPNAPSYMMCKKPA